MTVLINVLTFITDLSRIAIAEEKVLFTKSQERSQKVPSASLTSLYLGNSTATLSLKVIVLEALLIFAKLNLYLTEHLKFQTSA